MIALIQRVRSASVSVENDIVGSIDKGQVVFLGVFAYDSPDDAVFLANRCVNLRIFADKNDAMNLSLLDIRGSMLAISQFTLCANARKGRRPSFSNAMPPQRANELYELFCEKVTEHGIPVEKGIFGARMIVQLVNDGPVTFILDSKESRRGNPKNDIGN